MTSKKEPAAPDSSDERADAPAEESHSPDQETKAAPEGSAEQPKIEELLAELEELRAKAQERDAIFDRLQHTTADFMNYQKRVRKEREMLRQFAVQDLVEALLPCLDNSDHAIAAAQNSPDRKLLEGVRLVEQEFLRVLQNFGVERMDVGNAPFDPNFHEAVVQEETDAVPHETVMEELRAGYTLNSRVIRAAQVKVSRHPRPETSIEKGRSKEG